MTKVYKNFIDGVPVAVIAEQMGLKYTTAIQRFKKFGTLEKPIHHLKGKDSCNLKILFEGRKLTEWAAHYGVPYSTVFMRYKRYGTVHPIQPRIKHNGKTPRELAEQYGLSRNAVYERIKQGIPLDTTVVKGKRKRAVVFEGKSLIEWSEHYGVSRALIYDRYKKHGTVHPKWKIKNPSA